MEPQKESTFVAGDWYLLCRIGAVAAWFSALLIPLAIISHIVWPPPVWEPGAAHNWFLYLHKYPVAGLLNLDLALEVGLVVSLPLYLALYVVLKEINPSLMVIALVTALLGTLLHIFSNTAWELYLLSRAYFAAPAETARTVFLAAGEARLSAYYGMVFQVSYVLGYLAYIFIGLVMRRSLLFGKTTGSLAIITGIGGFGFYLPEIGVLFSVLVVALIGIWNVIVGLRLFKGVKANLIV